ncbi:hypothetical protein NEAUS05_0125 [Nematocida ausubeli]|nr:hypothetical protein NEAUS07_0321 [Nematocida ausubeli]KAI5146683.1 hypothetical protein NEAUS05_0125 [Nematocida ausubeli]
MDNEEPGRKQKISMLLTLKNIQELKDYHERGLFPVFNTRFQKRDFKKKAKMFITTNKGMLMREVNGVFLMAVANNDLERIHSICRYAHDKSNHCKTEDSWKKIRTHWMGFRKKHIADWISKCTTCQSESRAAVEAKPAKNVVPQIRPVSTTFSMERLQVDCISMNEYAMHNDGFYYLVHCMDVHSLYHFAFPLQRKDPREFAQCLVALLWKEGWPHIIQTDADMMFFSDELSSLFAFNQVLHIYQTNEYSHSLSIIRRTRSALKKKLIKRMKAKECLYRWISVLSDVLSEWNNEFSLSIMGKPRNFFKTLPPDIDRYMHLPVDSAPSQ